ncbi:hypothetical protein [Variovorax saccharolyticus]|uniref:hypothetical protein n=1 Tax=Variovorax saccharolyticus TaxID=3053516 RepID=UPI002578B0F9|nr:hypothetical protein [Variovorax sp. J22R187]MDM0022101.1 hypothetical protein [Variovorax sp. J22R187]
MSDWGRLESLMIGLRTEIAKSSDPRVLALDQHAAKVAQDVVTAKNAGNDAAFDQFDVAVRNLWADVQRPVGSVAKESKLGMMGGMAGVAAVIIGTTLLLWTFVSRSSGGSLLNIDGVRPIITFAAIISTVGFGGSLVFAALFASDANFETRFRTAREIFLVFSSVFATVVGFHFAGGTGVPPPTPVPLTVTEMKDVGGTIYLSINGGTPPYTVEADFEGVKVDPVTGSSPLALNMSKVTAYGTVLTPKSQITVTDSAKGVRKLPMKGIKLDKDTDLPVPTPAPAAPAPAAAPPNPPLGQAGK